MTKEDLEREWEFAISYLPTGIYQGAPEISINGQILNPPKHISTLYKEDCGADLSIASFSMKGLKEGENTIRIQIDREQVQRKLALTKYPSTAWAFSQVEQVIFATI